MRCVKGHVVLRASVDLGLRLYLAGHALIALLSLLGDWPEVVRQAKKDHHFLSLAPEIWLVLACILVAVTGPLLVFGVLTRISAALLAGLTCLIVFRVEFDYTFIFQFFLLCWLAATGAGDWSVDAVCRRRGHRLPDKLAQVGHALAQAGLRSGLGLLCAVMGWTGLSPNLMPVIPKLEGIGVEIWAWILLALAPVLLIGWQARPAGMIAICIWLVWAQGAALSAEPRAVLYWLCLLAALLMVYGPGRWSVDALIKRRPIAGEVVPPPQLT